MYRRPDESECHPYYFTYINKVKGDDFLAVLREALKKTPQFLSLISEDRWDFRYAPDKWSTKEVLIHIIDCERIFGYRALRIARNDKSPMAGFDQNEYVPYSGADQRSPESIIDEYFAVRASTLTLFENFNIEMFDRNGTASDRPFTPLALGFITAGHEIHHLGIIRDRYLDL